MSFKSNASFTWKSVCAAIPLLNNGLCWRIGDGESVDVWKDRWIPTNHNMKPRTPDLRGEGETPVALLLDHFSEGWDVDILKLLFWEEDVTEILKIPTGNRETPDTLVWNFTKGGYYTVRSAYHLAMKLRREEMSNKIRISSYSVSRNWACIWRCKVPNKIKSFLVASSQERTPCSRQFDEA